jgi:hypothetical protein
MFWMGSIAIGTSFGLGFARSAGFDAVEPGRRRLTASLVTRGGRGVLRGESGNALPETGGGTVPTARSSR